VDVWHSSAWHGAFDADALCHSRASLVFHACGVGAFASHKDWVEKHGEISAAGLAKRYLQHIKFAKTTDKADEMSESKVKVALQVYHSLLLSTPILQRIQAGFNDFGCAFWLFRQCRTCLRESMLLSDMQHLQCPSGRPPWMAAHLCIVVSFSGTFDTGRLAGIEKMRLFSSVVKGEGSITLCERDVEIVVSHLNAQAISIAL
jgi:hypothetical protein